MKNEKGITLIALIITIIVMIILIGVTINIAINGGLFGQASDSVRKQEEQEIYERMLGMMVFKLNGDTDVKATVEAIENSGAFNIKSKNPNQVTNETTEVTLTIAGKYGNYKYLVKTSGITIIEREDEGQGGETVSTIDITATYSSNRLTIQAGEGAIEPISFSSADEAADELAKYYGSIFKVQLNDELDLCQYMVYQEKLDTRKTEAEIVAKAVEMGLTVSNIREITWLIAEANSDEQMKQKIENMVSATKQATDYHLYIDGTEVEAQWSEKNTKAQYNVPYPYVGEYSISLVIDGKQGTTTYRVDDDFYDYEIGDYSYGHNKGTDTVYVSGLSSAGQQKEEITTSMQSTITVKGVELTVSDISGRAFRQNYNLKITNLPNTIKTIGISSFELCHGLESITIPEGVETIYDDAFLWCSNLKNIMIPSTVQSIGPGFLAREPETYWYVDGEWKVINLSYQTLNIYYNGTLDNFIAIQAQPRRLGRRNWADDWSDETFYNVNIICTDRTVNMSEYYAIIDNMN